MTGSVGVIKQSLWVVVADQGETLITLYNRYELGHKQQQLKQVIDAMGEASGRVSKLFSCTFSKN